MNTQRAGRGVHRRRARFVERSEAGVGGASGVAGRGGSPVSRSASAGHMASARLASRSTQCGIGEFTVYGDQLRVQGEQWGNIMTHAANATPRPTAIATGYMDPA